MTRRMDMTDTHAGGGTPTPAGMGPGAERSDTAKPKGAATAEDPSRPPEASSGCLRCLVTAAIAALMPETKCAGCIARRTASAGGA